MSILFFVILTEDLGSELAKQKDEVSYIVATLNESVDFVNFNTPVTLFYSPTLFAYLVIENVTVSKDYSSDFSSGRLPPPSGDLTSF